MMKIAEPRVYRGKNNQSKPINYKRPDLVSGLLFEYDFQD